MPAAATDYVSILRTLVENKVEFVVVGGLSEVLHGAPIVTLDLDIVPSRAKRNLDRFLIPLQSLDVHFREHKDRKVRPTRSILDTSGHLLLVTSKGPLDVVGSIGEDLGYDDLLKDAPKMKVATSLRVRVLNLEKFVEIKEKLTRDKDRATLPLLRRTLEEKQRARKRT